MAAPKRTPFQREKDLQETAKLYLRGARQIEIAEKMGVTQGQISQDLATLRKRWQQSALVDINEIKARDVAELEEVAREYWTAWQRSQEAARKTRAVKGDGEGGKSTAMVEETEQVGDPRFLQGVERVLERRAKIYGIDAPTKIAPTDPTGAKEYDQDNSGRDRAISSLADAIRTGILAASPGGNGAMDAAVAPAVGGGVEQSG